MSSLQIGIAALVAMFALMALRMPIAMAMFLPGAVAYVALSGPTAWLAHLKGLAYSRLSVYDLSVIPLFLLMGQFATRGGLSRSLFGFANAVVGSVRGGMAMASILACAAFGSICGSSVATAATMTQVALPEMAQNGYSGRMSTSTLAVGGTLGILVPPSVVLVIYGIITEQNIAKLFAAAFVPAALAMLLYIATIAITVMRSPEQGPAAERRSAQELKRLLLGVWPALLVFTVVFGGIYGGVFTATEGAAVGAAGTFGVALLRGELPAARMRECFWGTAETAGMIFTIFLGADMLNSALALSQLPAQLADTVMHVGLPPMGIVAAVLVFYVLLGCVMDELSIILLTVPIVFPAIMTLDLGLEATDKALWFGILVLCTVEIGLVAPPVGLNVYVVNSFAEGVPMWETYKGVFPFLLATALRILLLMAFPSLSLWLVRLLT